MLQRPPTRLDNITSAEAYANGHILTEEEKEKLYNEIKGIPGAEWYDRHKHSNFCTRFEREAASSARGLFQSLS